MWREGGSGACGDDVRDYSNVLIRREDSYFCFCRCNFLGAVLQIPTNLLIVQVKIAQVVQIVQIL